MRKFVFISILAIMLLLSGCQYFTSGDKTSATGDVVLDGDFIFLNDSGDVNDSGVDNSSEVAADSSKDGVELTDDSSSVGIDESEVSYVVTVTEGELVSLDLEAVDPDGDSLDFEYTSPLNAQGRWQTEIGDEGKYLVTVTATDGKLSTSEDVLIIVKRANRPPTIECPPTITIKEGQELNVDCNIYDEEGDKMVISYEGWTTSRTKQTGFDDAGEYTVLVRASDQSGFSTKKVNVIVENVNRAPVIEPLDDITVMETNTVIVSPEVSDPDGDEVAVSFSSPLDENGRWETVDGDAGVYEVVVTATDGSAMSTDVLTITVTNINTAPVLKKIGDLTFEEGDLIVLPVNAYDPEGDNLTVSYEGFMGGKEYQTTYDDAGVYEETVTVSDGVLSTSETFTITIKDKNRAPVFVFGGDQ